MVPDPETDSAATPPAADRGAAGDARDDPTYDVVYRATRDALWDVVGTATLILFYLALTGIAFTIAYAGLGSLLSESPAPVAVAVGAGGLFVGAVSVYRVYSLTTE